jgi:hypothetical protein
MSFESDESITNLDTMDMDMDIDVDDVLSPIRSRELYFLKRYRSRIHIDIVNEKDSFMKEYLKRELDDLNEVIYDICNHSFVGDEFEIGIEQLQKVYYCIHCEMEMRTNEL